LKELPKVYFERLLESSPDIVIAVDSKGTIIFYNDGAKGALGFNPDDILGAHVETFYPSRAEARRVMDAMRSEEHGGSGQLKNFETEFVNASGESVPVAISGTVIHDEKGRERGSIGFAKDIAELRVHDHLAQVTLVNQVQLLERYLREKASVEDYRTEHERIDAMKRELRRIQAIVERVGEMAAAGVYGTIEYLPGRLMTDLGLDEGDTDDSGERERIGAANGHLSGKTVLVVDDDADICNSMADILAAEGCDIITSRSGVEAMAYIRSRDLDMVLSDVCMPDMDGYELYEEIRSTKPELPVVLMTAYYYDKDHVIKRSKANGLSDVIFKKPIDPARLIELIDARVGG
jgi:PAS domain S-box-containing protein